MCGISRTAASEKLCDGDFPRLSANLQGFGFSRRWLRVFLVAEVVSEQYLARMYPYKRIRISKTQTRDQHRIVMESILGRALKPDEIVHHKDGNKRNNAPSNLEVMSRKTHMEHHRGDLRHKWPDERRAKWSERMRRGGHPQSIITEEIAALIKNRIRDGVRNKDIAIEFGIGRPMVSLIRHGKRWA